MNMEYAVKAETFEGNIFTLRRGFASQDAAEDHPVKLASWKRVWVEPIAALPITRAEATLPPKPWDWVSSASVTANGLFQAYLVDANGRKLAAIWGKAGEKELIADHIIERVNAQS